MSCTFSCVYACNTLENGRISQKAEARLFPNRANSENRARIRERAIAQTFSLMPTTKRGLVDGRANRYRHKLIPSDSDNPDSYKVRRGKVGGYSDYLSAEDIAYCDEVLKHYTYFETCRALILASLVRQRDVRVQQQECYSMSRPGP
jgi:hypothetical protein